MTTKTLAGQRQNPEQHYQFRVRSGSGQATRVLRRAGMALLVSLTISGAQANLPELEILDQLNTPPLSPEVPSSSRYAQERVWFEQAEEAIRKGQRRRYESLQAHLQDYPLYPYLELLELQSRFHLVETAEVEAKVQKYADLPLADLIKTRWLYELGRRGRWQGLLATMPESTRDTGLRCLGLRARLETGDRQTIDAQMPELWLTGASLPDHCDPVIKAWHRDGGLTSDLAWQRAALAIKAGNPGLAKYLKRFLPADLAAATDRLQEVHAAPQRLEKTREFHKGLPRITEIVAHGMVQYSRRDPEKAARLWTHYRELLPFTPAQASLVNRNVGLMLAVRYLPESTALLTEASSVDGDPNLYEWQARVYLRRGEWKTLAETLNRFPEDLRETSRWQYWLARAEEQLGNAESAKARYVQAAGERNFYGFLAADRLGAPYRLNHQPHPFSKEDLVQVRALPAVDRAHEFFRMGRINDARREWRGLLSRLDNGQVLVASQLAKSWGWAEQGVMGAIAAQEWNDLQLRFPLAHQELFTNHATLQRLDVNWVYALARQESAFMADARSSAGALGLLQLLPGTARQTAREIGLRFRNDRQLLEPAQNIQLGTAHLAELLSRFDNNRILATAAYNAGAHRVSEWLENGGDRLDVDIWIETMPYYETRQYVQNVLAYTVIYGFRRGEPPAHLLTERELACICLPSSLSGADPERR